MKEAYAVRRTVPPSAEIEEQIDRLLAVGVGENPRESLSELAKLGARLIIQRAVEDEFDAWLGRARYERRPEAPPGLRNGFRPRRVQTAEGELSVEIPQVRAAAEPFVSKLFPRGTKLLRTEPLRAMVIGAFVRGLSMRDVESLCEQAGLGKLSKSTASRICSELRERFERVPAPRPLRHPAWRRCSSTRSFSPSAPTGPRRACWSPGASPRPASACCLSVMLGMRESHEDWLALGRDLIARGLGAPMLIVADGAPGLIKAIEQCWPASDRQHCAVHRVRNLLAKLPERERERVRQAYWQALDEATSERDGKQRLQALVDELDRAGYTAAARCLGRRPRRARRAPALPDPPPPAVAQRPTCSNGRSARSNAAPRSSAASPARPAASRSSGPSSTSTSATPPTASSSPSSNASTSSASRYEGHDQTTPEEVTAA